MKKKISLLSLILLVIAAIDSMRNLSAAALFGSSLMFFFILGALIFLIPTSLIAAELSAAFPNKGGIYHWVHKAFGEKTAMLSIWLQWINTMVWYPTILSFIAGTAAYLFDPTWKDNTLYLVGVILTIFWVLTFINMFGLSISAKVNNLCVLIGTIFPLLLLVVLGCIWVLSGEIVHISGVDFSQLDEDAGILLNWEHEPGEKSANTLVGKVIYLKKIFKLSDCENDRQIEYWNKVKENPYIYVI